jgi:hypothetical protein
VARRHHPVLRDDGRAPAAAGRLGIVLRARLGERREHHGNDDERLSACHAASTIIRE